MKIALFVVAVFALLWLLRGSQRRRDRPGPGTATPPPQGQAQPIIACAQCGVHLPRDEALPGRGGVFCSDPHRAAFERAHGGA